MNKVDELKELVNKYKGNLWNLSEQIIDYIYREDDDMQEQVFTMLLEYVDISEFDLPEMDDHITLTEEQFQEFRDVSKTAERILLNLINSNTSESEFYKKLWKKFNDKDLFTNSDDRTALLLSLWLDVRIPYFQLSEGCSMENDEFREYLNQLSSEIRKARFIIYKKMQQRTQRISLLMELAESITDKTKRIVFWTYVTSLLTQKETTFISRRSSEKKTEKEDNE